MKLHFEWSGIERLLQEIRTARTVKNLNGEETGKGFWLVGDVGVYLMANTTDGVHNRKMGLCDEHFVVYADECNPDEMNPDDWDTSKRASLGDKDSIHFIDTIEIEELAIAGISGGTPTSLCIDFGGEEPVISILWTIKRCDTQ